MKGVWGAFTEDPGGLPVVGPGKIGAGHRRCVGSVVTPTTRQRNGRGRIRPLVRPRSFAAKHLLPGRVDERMNWILILCLLLAALQMAGNDDHIRWISREPGLHRPAGEQQQPHHLDGFPRKTRLQLDIVFQWRPLESSMGGGGCHLSPLNQIKSLPATSSYCFALFSPG